MFCSPNRSRSESEQVEVRAGKVAQHGSAMESEDVVEGGGLYEVYDRAVRSHHHDDDDTRAAAAPTSTSTALSCALLSCGHSVYVFDTLSRELLVFTSLDDFGKPTRFVISPILNDPFARVTSGHLCLCAETEKGAVFVITEAGDVEKVPSRSYASSSLLGREGTKPALLIAAIQPGDRREVLAAKENAVIEVFCYGSRGGPESSSRERTRSVRCSKWHASVVAGCYSAAGGGTVCLVGGAGGALETVSVWRLDREGSLSTIQSKPTAHAGLGQNRFQRYLWNPWGALVGRGGSSSAHPAPKPSDYAVSLSPLGRKVAIRTPLGLRLFSHAAEENGGGGKDEVNLEALDCEAVLGAAGWGDDGCGGCAWWSEGSLMASRAGGGDLAVVDTKDRRVVLEHHFEGGGAVGAILPLTRSKAVVLRSSTGADAESSCGGWVLSCVARRTPEQMLHSHLARSRFAEARRVAEAFHLDQEVVSKREWLSLGAEADTAEAVRSMLREVKDDSWCTEQCVASVGGTEGAQRELVSEGLRRVDAMLVAGGSQMGEVEVRALLEQRVRLLGQLDALETSLALLGGMYHREAYAEFR